MKVLLAAGRNAGKACLEHLIKDKADVVGVMARDDRADDKWYHSPYSSALLKGIPIIEPTEEAIDKLAPDVLFSVYYHKRIPGAVLRKIPLAINFHGGILPDYQGCNSNMWAIINGERQCGATAHIMEEQFDRGDIVGQKRFPIRSSDSGREVYRNTEALTVTLFDEIYSQTKRGALVRIPQPTGGNYYKKDLPNGGFIDTSWPIEKMERFIRAYHFPPFEPAKFSFWDTEICINRAYVENGILRLQDAYVRKRK